MGVRIRQLSDKSKHTSVISFERSVTHPILIWSLNSVDFGRKKMIFYFSDHKPANTNPGSHTHITGRVQYSLLYALHICKYGQERLFELPGSLGNFRLVDPTAYKVVIERFGHLSCCGNRSTTCRNPG